MVRYIVRRLLQTVLVLLGATLIVFALMFAGGKGDPIQSIAGDRPVTAAQRAYLMAKYHLDEGFWQRYAHYIKDILSGDLGRSLRGQEIKDILAREWPVTFQLALIALAVSAIFGVSAGIVAGVRRGSIFDASTLVIALILIGIPTIAIAPVAKLLFGVRLGWFPPTASNPASLDELILPGIILGLLSLATTMRLTRASVSENLRSDFVRTATAKGLPRRRVIGVHVLRNTLIPIITFLGVGLGSLIGGAIVVETVFNVPGVGAELRRSLNLGDAPMVIAIVTILVIVFVLANLIVDLLYAVLDPRIRRE